MERNQFTAGGMLQMDLVMKKFLEYFEEKEKMRYSENCLPWENHSGSCGLDINRKFFRHQSEKNGFFIWCFFAGYRNILLSTLLLFRIPFSTVERVKKGEKPRSYAFFRLFNFSDTSLQLFDILEK